MCNFEKGSEWRRWDLHLHTPGTKLSDGYGDTDDVWDKYIDFLENSPVQAFGITDYFSCDSYFLLTEKYKKKGGVRLTINFLKKSVKSNLCCTNIIPRFE